MVGLPGNGQLLAVHFARRLDGAGELHCHVLLRPAVHLHHAQYDFVAQFGFLERHDLNARIVHGDERKLLPERALVLGRFEGHERLIQAIALPIGERVMPIAAMSGEPEDDFVMAPILVSLVGITAVHAGRAQQGQTQSVVVRLVGTVLAIGKNGRAEAAAAVGEVDPLVRSDFELPLGGVGAAHRAESPIVSGVLITRGERERGLQIRIEGLPVNRLAELHAIAGIARR